MTMVRFDPFRELATMQDRINRIFGDAYTRRYDDGDLTQRGEWLPAVDIYENANQEIVLKAELPGIAREDIDLRVENNTLTLRGERKRDTDGQARSSTTASSGRYGGFSRSFSLPSRIDTEKVRAEFKDGVLVDHAAGQGRGEAAADRGGDQLESRIQRYRSPSSGTGRRRDR